MSVEEVLETIVSFNDAFNRHDVDAVVDLMTEDAVFENTSGSRFEGQEAVRAVLTRAFALMSPGWFDTDEIFAAEDRCVVRWTYAFRRGEPERGFVQGVDLFRVRETKVSEKFSYVKSEDFVEKLGLEIAGA
jgi:limonene-1,2-epoxide hydrolase